MANPPGSFIWYELLTTDIAAAADFYETVAGIKISREATPGPMDYRMIIAPDGDNVGGAMELTQEMRDGGAFSGWFGYLGVPDVDAAAEQVKAAGALVHMSPTDIPGAGRIAMISDPQGAPLYIMKPTPPADAPDMDSLCYDPAKLGHFAWNEYHGTDQAAAFDFYAGQFGWEKSDAMDMGPMGTYQMFKAGGTDNAIGGMMNSPNMPHPIWLYYLNVPDIDAALAAANANGAALLYGPGEIPGGQFIVQATDPQGAMFAVVGPRKAA